MKIFALTGGIASGKSTVGQLFEKLGAIVIWADEIAKQVYLKGSEVYEKILNRYGSELLNSEQEISHPKLAKILFHHPHEKEWLESIIHPATFKVIEKEIQKASQKNPNLILVEAALHIETGYYKRFKGLIVVDVEPEIQLERLMKRDSLHLEEAKLRIHSQLPLHEKRKYADWIIDNSQSLQETEKQVLELFNSFTQP